MKQPSAPASVVGTANPFSGEITEALVKSHRHLVGHFPFPFKRKGGEGGGRRRKMVKVGDKKKVKGPREGWKSCVM